MILYASQLNGRVPESDRRAIKSLMTPQSVLDNPLADGIEPIKITPEHYWNFESILADRDKIRDLKILPVKASCDRQAYNDIKHTLGASVKEMMGTEKMAYTINKYPYFLPPDINQGLIWVCPFQQNYTVTQFIAKVLKSINCPIDQMIIFERPKKCDTPLIKGTFPDVRHIHLWTKKNAQ